MSMNVKWLFLGVLLCASFVAAETILLVDVDISRNGDVTVLKTENVEGTFNTRNVLSPSGYYVEVVDDGGDSLYRAPLSVSFVTIGDKIVPCEDNPQEECMESVTIDRKKVNKKIRLPYFESTSALRFMNGDKVLGTHSLGSSGSDSSWLYILLLAVVIAAALIFFLKRKKKSKAWEF
jgi:LPXTG-motif cell wall-anchored protein